MNTRIVWATIILVFAVTTCASAETATQMAPSASPTPMMPPMPSMEGQEGDTGRPTGLHAEKAAMPAAASKHDKTPRLPRPPASRKRMPANRPPAERARAKPAHAAAIHRPAGHHKR